MFFIKHMFYWYIPAFIFMGVKWEKVGIPTFHRDNITLIIHENESNLLQIFKPEKAS